jgi:hypothetical protein
MRGRSVTLDSVLSVIATVENKLARDASGAHPKCVADVYVIFAALFKPSTDHGTD